MAESKAVTQERFDTFLTWIAPAEAEPGEAYLRLRFRLTTYFAHRNCRFPEDLADETINRVIVKLGETDVQHKLAFVFGFAKNVFRESLRKEKDHKNIDDIVVAAKEPEEEADFSGECLDKCLKQLSGENRDLILDYFSEEKQAKIDLHIQIAERLAMTQTALRMKVVRLKQKLRVCVVECLT